MINASLRVPLGTVPSSPLIDLAQLVEDGAELYERGGLPRGSLPGWPALDELYSVAPGQWTIITGVPGSGKSEWLDALAVNLAETADWEWCLYSPENWPPYTHLIKLAEKRARLPFNRGVSTRMSLQQYRESAAWCIQHFYWIDPALKTPDEIINIALRYRQRGRNLGIVLDPWNTLDHQRGTMSETDYVSYILTEVTKLSRSKIAHIFLIAHPQKMYRNKDGTRSVPTPYDISGSAHWYNKADNVLCIHRDQAQGAQEVEVHVQKVRFKHIGHAGLAVLRYDKVTGRYFEMPNAIEGVAYTDPERGRTPAPETFDPEAEDERAAIQTEGGA